MLTAIIVAAGTSQRMGFDKLFADLGGRPVVAWSVAAFQACAAVDGIVLVTRPEKKPLFRNWPNARAGRSCARSCPAARNGIFRSGTACKRCGRRNVRNV